MKKKRKSVSYAKWGYIFILPFFITYLIFSLIPLVDTVRFSFFEYYRSGIKQIGPNFVGWANYAELLKSDMITYGKNTLILWVIGFIPQIVVALVLANWFTDARLKIHKLFREQSASGQRKKQTTLLLVSAHSSGLHTDFHQLNQIASG